MKKTLRQLSVIIGLLLFSTVSAQDYVVPPMVNIPSGSFIMGSERGNNASKPAHTVSVAAFQMAKYHVTVAEFRLFVKETNYKSNTVKCPDLIDEHWYSDPGKKSNGTWEKNFLSYSDYQPVTCITHQDVDAYITWLNKKSGLKFRLPTEEEWEYAAKANTTSEYFWGDDVSQSYLYANYADQASEYFAGKQYGASYVGFLGISDRNDGEPYGSIVGMYHPNPFGLYDMVGNVSQMLSSCYEPYDQKIASKQEKEPKKCDILAVRGNSWHYPPEPLWVRGRGKVKSDYSSTRRGFRLAMDGHRTTEKLTSTKAFEKALKKAQHIRFATRPTMPNVPKDVQLIHLKDSIYKISWKASADPTVIGYEIYQSTTPYAHLLGRFYQKHYDKIKTVSAKNNSSEVILSDKGNSFRVLAKTSTQTSLPSNPITVVKEVNITSIPGTIKMEHTTGLENINLIHRKARPDRPELYYLSAFNEFYEQTVATATFKVQVEESGWYKLNYSGGRGSRKADTFFMLYQGTNLVGDIPYDSKVDHRTTDIHKVHLEKGQHDLKVSFFLDINSMDLWNLGSLKFTKLK